MNSNVLHSPPSRFQLDLTDMTKFDFATAHLACFASYYAYYEEAADFFTTYLGATSVRLIPYSPSSLRPQVWVMELPECWVVACAGSTNTQQIFNYLARMFYWKPQLFPSHAYVGNWWGMWADEVHNAWKDTFATLFADKKVIFTGHSAGAALATILARQYFSFANPGANKVTSYAFGCPRVGNEDAAYWCQLGFNIFQNDDIVAKLPYSGYCRWLTTAGEPAGTLRVMPNDPFMVHGQTGELLFDGSVRLGQMTGGFSNLKPTSLSAELFNYNFSNINSRSNNLQGIYRDAKDSLYNHTCEDYLRTIEKGALLNEPRDDDFVYAARKKELTIPADPLNDAPPVLTPAPAVVPTVDPGIVPLRKRRHH